MNAQGRPNELKKGKPTLFYIEENDLQAFKALSVKQGKSMSELVRVFVKDYLKKHQNNDQASMDLSIENPNFTALPTMGEMLPREKLDELDDEDLQDLMKAVTARHQEIFGAARRRRLD